MIQDPPTYTVLILMTRALAVLSECLEGLVDEGDVVFVNVETQQTQTTCC